MSIRRNGIRVGLVVVTAAGALMAAESGPVGSRPADAAPVARAAAVHRVATVPPVQSRRYAYASRSARQQLTATWHTGTTRAPWVVTVHGGSWVKGSPTDVDDAAELFSRNGYQVFNIGYRLVTATGAASPVHWNDQRADVVTAVAWIRRHAAAFGLDPNRGALYGSSAGGNLVLSAGLAGDGRNGVRAIVTASGVVQPTQLWDDILGRNRGAKTTVGMRRLAQFAQRAAGCSYPRGFALSACGVRWRAMDAITGASPHDPAVMLFQGRGDHTVPVRMAQRFRAQLDRADIGGSLVLARGVGHSQLVVLDGGARQAAMLDFVARRTAVATVPALSRLTVSKSVRSVKGAKVTRVTVRVTPRRAGVPVAGSVSLTSGRADVHARLRGGRATLTVSRALARDAKATVRYEGSPVLQPHSAVVTLRASRRTG